MPTLGFNGSSQDSAAAAANTVQGGRNWLQLASARNDPMLAFQWDIDFIFPAGLSGIAPLPPEMVEDIQLPLSRFDVDNVYFQGQRFYFAKFEEYSPVSIKFYEDNRGTVTTFFYNWKQLIRNANGDYGLPANYMGTVHIYPLDQTNARILDIELVNFFPLSFGSFGFTSAAGRQEMSLEFQVSQINISFAQSGQSASQSVSNGVAQFAGDSLNQFA